MGQWSAPRTTRVRVVMTALIALTVWLALAALDTALADHTGLPPWVTGPISLLPMLALHAGVQAPAQFVNAAHDAFSC